MKKIFRFFLPILLICLIAGCSSTPAKSKLAKEMNLDNQQEAAMIETFKQCGIGEVTSIEKVQVGEAHTSYHIQDKEVSVFKGMKGKIVVFVDNTNKTVESIYFQDNDIYTNGQVIVPVTNFYVNSKDRDKYRVICQEIINKCLKIPDSAKYPSMSGWAFGVENGVVIVQSTVTAKNPFNVELKHPFQIKFQNGQPVSLIIDKKEYMK